jgi:hypothetical protein
MLKKQISRSKKLAELKTDSARLLYTWIIPHLDVKGRLEADPQLVKGEIVPRLNTFTVDNVQEYLEDMRDVGLIKLYQVDGDQYLELINFEKHQYLNHDREAKSTIPGPTPDNSGPTPDNSGSTPDNSGSTPDNSESTPAQSKASKSKLREVKAREVRSTPEVNETEKEKPAAFCPSDNFEKPAKDETPFVPPDQDTIKDAPPEMIEQLINDIEAELTTSGIMKIQDLLRFKKNCNGANRRAVLHTLCQCYTQRPGNPGGFCRSVLKAENPNYYALEHEKAAEAYKIPRGEAGKILGEIKNHEPGGHRE